MATKLYKQDGAHKDSIWTVDWAKHGQDNLLVTGSCDETVCSWEVRDGAEEGAEGKESLSLKHVFPDHNMGAVSVVCSSTAPVAISSGMDCRLRVLDLVDGSIKATIDAGPVECWTLACAPSGDAVASGTHTGAVNIWNLETSKLTSTLESPGGTFVLSVAYSPDGTKIASGSKDGTVRLFDIASGKVVHAFTSHAMPVRSVCFSPDGSTLFAGSDDLVVSLHDVKKGSQSGSLRGHLSWVLSVAARPDNRLVATGSSDNTVKLWDAAERSCVHTFERSHSDQVHGVAFSRDGSRLASVGGEGNIQVYSIPA